MPGLKFGQDLSRFNPYPGFLQKDKFPLKKKKKTKKRARKEEIENFTNDLHIIIAFLEIVAISGSDKIKLK